MPEGTSVYFDSSVYLAVFLDEPTAEVAEASLDCALQGLTRGHLSGLVMAEVVGCPALRAPQGPPDPEWAPRLAKAVEYFRASRFRYVEEARRAGERAMDLAVEFGLKGPDALHLSLAESSGCAEFYSYDDNHLKVADQLPSMKVMKPYGDPQTTLDV